MIQQGREQGVNEANRRSQPFSAFRCDPLTPLGFEIAALDHVGLEKVGRVEQTRSPTELLDVSRVGTLDEGETHTLTKVPLMASANSYVRLLPHHRPARTTNR